MSNIDYLENVGKIWSVSDLPTDLIVNDTIDEIVHSVAGLITNKEPKSVIISGNRGVGKSTIIDLLCAYLKNRGWEIFSASAANLMAGQRYIGDLEQNVKNVVDTLKSNKKVLWVVPRFHELYYGGKHEFSPVSILDQLLPDVEVGDLRIVSEDSDDRLEKVMQFRPQVRGVFEIIHISPSSKSFTLDLVRDWTMIDQVWQSLSQEELEESYYLSSQYLSHQAQPGALMNLLRHTQKMYESKKSTDPIALKNIVESVSSLTGLPENILDDGEILELDKLEAYFSEKVIGQEDAVKTITERIAMIKAGLTDPTKPAGVFLFVGPTGTGKTEIAKALADYLFGSEDRLIRMDMSEFQTADSLFKLVGGSSDVAESAALVNLIRRNPFSVVLLDEFEKAHVNIWDLFLQVFDDGRLTDQTGNTADFRHSIIILTSNLGAGIPSAGRIGFGHQDEADEVDTSVMKSIEQTFRPEFINRLDSIVVFNPLTKAVAKLIMKNELKKILTRRGLRRRGWELDFEDSALDFLLQKGFSDTLGARPLKRAIEKYLLAPLARTIVNHNFPKGDQFLLVGASREKLKVDFIDPDYPEINWEQKQQIVKDQEKKVEGLSLQEIIADSRGTLSEFRFVEKELAQLSDIINKNELSDRKNTLMEQMAAGEFWESPERYETLDEVEFIDRVESAFETASNLYNRLNDPGKERLSYDAKLVKRIGERIWLIRLAIEAYSEGLSQDAFLMVQYNEHNVEKGEKVYDMYKNWARSRGMKIDQVLETTEAGERSRFYSVVGFGAYSILEAETGYHVFEEHDEETKPKKSKVKVVVLPMLLEDYRDKTFKSPLKRFQENNSQKNIRRYIFNKSPLVKDLKNNWQTGKVERVLKGDFDLFN
ncbi:MAG: AAA family ATPase [Bacteroidota bacterium]